MNVESRSKVVKNSSVKAKKKENKKEMEETDEGVKIDGEVDDIVIRSEVRGEGEVVEIDLGS